MSAFQNIDYTCMCNQSRQSKPWGRLKLQNRTKCADKKKYIAGCQTTDSLVVEASHSLSKDNQGLINGIPGCAHPPTSLFKKKKKKFVWLCIEFGPLTIFLLNHLLDNQKLEVYDYLITSFFTYTPSQWFGGHRREHTKRIHDRYTDDFTKLYFVVNAQERV